LFTRNKLLLSGRVFGFGFEELGRQVESRLGPLDVEVEREGDAVVFVVDL
jgi:hypothetical protein